MIHNDRDPGPCPVCGSAHTACVPAGWVPPVFVHELPPTTGSVADLPADEYELVDWRTGTVRVLTDVWVDITHIGSPRVSRSLLWPVGAVITVDQALGMRAIYGQDQA